MTISPPSELQVLLDVWSEPAFLVSSGEIRHANPAACLALGVERETLRGSEWRVWCPDADVHSGPGRLRAAQTGRDFAVQLERVPLSSLFDCIVARPFGGGLRRAEGSVSGSAAAVLSDVRRATAVLLHALAGPLSRLSLGSSALEARLEEIEGGPGLADVRAEAHSISEGARELLELFASVRQLARSGSARGICRSFELRARLAASGVAVEWEPGAPDVNLPGETPALLLLFSSITSALGGGTARGPRAKVIAYGGAPRELLFEWDGARFDAELRDLALARAVLGRLGGRLEWRRDDAGNTRVSLHLPVLEKIRPSAQSPVGAEVGA